MAEFKAFWRNYTNFTDRTTRRGYWIAWLYYMLIGFGVPLFVMPLFAMFFARAGAGVGVGFITIRMIFLVLWNGVILVPSLAIAIRRMRDAGIHWALIFIIIIPVLGLIAHTIMLIMPSRDTELNMNVPVV